MRWQETLIEQLTMVPKTAFLVSAQQYNQDKCFSPTGCRTSSNYLQLAAVAQEVSSSSPGACRPLFSVFGKREEVQVAPDQVASVTIGRRAV